jgi:hypothetical protein
MAVPGRNGVRRMRRNERVVVWEKGAKGSSNTELGY